MKYKREHDEIQMITMEQKYSLYRMCESMYRMGRGITKLKEGDDLVYVYKGHLMGKVPNFETSPYWKSRIPKNLKLKDFEEVMGV